MTFTLVCVQCGNYRVFDGPEGVSEAAGWKLRMGFTANRRHAVCPNHKAQDAPGATNAD